jgi:histidinol phosphatase-like enzyme
MNPPKLAIIDRDNTLCFASRDPSSPLYYILSPDHLILKPGVREAVQLLQAHSIPMILATKQRCISKGLVTQEQVRAIHDHLESLLGIEFDGICVEESAEDKGAIYHAILSNYPVKPAEVVLFDDSIQEVNIAASMGIRSYHSPDLLDRVKLMLNLP